VRFDQCLFEVDSAESVTAEPALPKIAHTHGPHASIETQRRESTTTNKLMEKVLKSGITIIALRTHADIGAFRIPTRT
jgi:hypothetical protein